MRRGVPWEKRDCGGHLADPIKAKLLHQKMLEK